MQNQKLNYKFEISSYYRKLVTVTLIAVYLLILAGGIVRSTGSGMGCPDWPKCFGTWVPPTDVSELPEGYQDFYAAYRHQKNIKFAQYLDFFGYQEIGEQILSDESIKEEAEFNAAKTWTEYMNRLLGALVGFLIILCVLGSLKTLKHNKLFFGLSFSCLIIVMFQGWLGSIVVSTNLLSWLITMHMLIAFLILAVLTALYYFTKQSNSVQYELKDRKGVLGLIIVGMVLMLIQVVLGTQVRETLDVVATQLGNALRGSWIDGLGLEFYVHRSFSLLIVAVHSYLFYKLFKISVINKSILLNTKILLTLIIMGILSGAVMAYFSIPFWVQPIHLVVSSMIFGMQFFIFLQLVYSTKKINIVKYAIS